MKKNKKITLLTTLMTIPSIAFFVQDTSAQDLSIEEQRAIAYFSSLNFNSSMADYALYMDVLNQAFPNDFENPKYKLLLGKLNYIKKYNEQVLAATNIKNEIANLTITNKNLLANYEETYTKYNALLLEIEQENVALQQLENNVVDPNYAELLKSIEPNYKQLATVTVQSLIGTASQSLLVTRGTQIANINASDYLPRILKLYQAVDETDYVQKINDAKQAFAKLTTDEKNIADNQAVQNTTITAKQVLASAEDNVAKASAFNTSINQFAVMQIDATNPDSIEQLKNQLVAIDKSYNALSDLQKKLISDSSKQVIEPFRSILAISNDIAKLVPAATDEYRDQLNAINTKISNLQPVTIGNTTISKEILEMVIPNKAMLETYLLDLTAVNLVEAQIAALTKASKEVPTTKEVADARTALNKLTASQKKIVRNSPELIDWELSIKKANEVDRKINNIVISNKTDFYKKTVDAKQASDALDPVTQLPYSVAKERLTAIYPFAVLVNDINTLSTSDKDYASKMAVLLKRLYDEWGPLQVDAMTALSYQDKDLVNSVREVLGDRRSATEKATALIEGIDQLEAVPTSELLNKLIEYRAIYNELDSNLKKAITNISKLAEYEKANSAAVNVVKQINALNPTATNFVSSAKNIRKAYDKLTPEHKQLIPTAYEKFLSYERISSVMDDIESLSKSKNILVDVDVAEFKFDNLRATLLGEGGYSTVIQLLDEKYAPKLTIARKRYENVSTIINAINQVLNNNTSTIEGVIRNIQTMYKALSPNDKGLVTNYKQFTNLDNDFKAAKKVYDLIENLPSKEATDYAKKVDAALKAYNKLKPSQMKYVFNYESKLKPVISVASLVGEIDQLKPSMKDYATVVADLRKRYDALSQLEKNQVSNYNKLQSAELLLAGAYEVVRLIQETRSVTEDQIATIQRARDAYDALSSDQKKLVTNYKELQDREKALKPILEASRLIDLIPVQSSAKNYISAYEKAFKAFEKISLQDRILLTNAEKLVNEYTPLYNVMNKIQLVKNTSNTFVDDVAAARKAYDQLSPIQQKAILNYDELLQHEVNVRGGEYVDRLIQALSSVSRDEYLAKVLEAEKAYKALSNANKKAVTLVAELNAELKYIKPVLDTIDAISGLATAGTKLNAQVKKVNTLLGKLNDDQYLLVYNIEDFNILENVIHTMTLIDLIKPSDTKYYIGNTRAAEIAYNRLSLEEKQKVSNYNVLEDALLNVRALEQLMEKINELSILSPNYLNDVTELLNQYKQLPSALKKHVLNYNVLEQAKKDIDVANKVVKLIALIDPDAKTFEDKVMAARKEYNKLTDAQKQLVVNLRLLVQYERDLGI